MCAPFLGWWNRLLICSLALNKKPFIILHSRLVWDNFIVNIYIHVFLILQCFLWFSILHCHSEIFVIPCPYKNPIDTTQDLYHFISVWYIQLQEKFEFMIILYCGISLYI